MKLTPFIRRVGFLEYFGIALVLFVAIFAYFYLSPKSTDITVTVRLADKDLIWLDSGSPKGLPAQAVKVGMKEYDMLGRVVAEVVRVTSFDQPRNESYYTNKKTVYVTLRMRASYNKKKNQYRYEGSILQIGDWVRFSVQSTMINGLIVNVPAKDRPEPVWVTVKAQLKSEGPFIYEPFYETTGVDKATADAIRVGDTAKDSEGNILAEILGKQVTASTITASDYFGNVFLRPHPRKVDVLLTVRIATQKVEDQLYYLDVLPIKKNIPLPLFLSEIDIEPRILDYTVDAR